MQPNGGSMESGGRGVTCIAAVLIGSCVLWTWLGASPEWIRWAPVAC